MFTAFLAPCTKTHRCATGSARLASPAPPPTTPCSSLATFKAGKGSERVRQLRSARQEDHRTALSISQCAHLAPLLCTFTLQGKLRQRFACSPRRARCVPALVVNWLMAVVLQQESEVSGLLPPRLCSWGRRDGAAQGSPRRQGGRNPRTTPHRPTLERRQPTEHHRPLSRTGVIPRRKILLVHFLFFPTKHMLVTRQTLRFSHGVSYKSSAQW